MHGPSHLPASPICLTLSLNGMESDSARPISRQTHVCIYVIFTHTIQTTPVMQHVTHTHNTYNTHAQRRHTACNTYTELSQNTQHAYMQNTQGIYDTHLTKHTQHMWHPTTYRCKYAHEFSFYTLGSRDLTCPLSHGDPEWGMSHPADKILKPSRLRMLTHPVLVNGLSLHSEAWKAMFRFILNGGAGTVDTSAGAGETPPS